MKEAEAALKSPISSQTDNTISVSPVQGISRGRINTPALLQPSWGQSIGEDPHLRSPFPADRGQKPLLGLQSSSALCFPTSQDKESL